MAKVDVVPEATKKAEQEKTPRKKKRLFRRFFMLLFFAIIVIGLFLPQILSNTSIRQYLTASLMKDFSGQIEIESTKMAWWKPVEISSLTMLDQEGVTVATIGSAKISTPLWRMFWPDDQPLVLEITKPEIILVVDKYGSNWQRLFSQQESEEEFTWPEFQHNAEPMRIKVIDGRVTVKDLVSKRTVESRHIQMMLEKSPQLVKGNMQGETMLILETKSELPAGKIEANFQLALKKNKAVAGEVQGKLEKTPLELIQPWLKQMAPGLHLAAESTDANFKSKWTGNLKTGLKLELNGEVVAHKIDLQSTELFSASQLRSEKLTSNFSIDNTLPNVPGKFDLSLEFDQCQIDPVQLAAAPDEGNDPFRKIAARNNPPQKPVDLGTLLFQSNGVIDGAVQQLSLQQCKLNSKPFQLEMEGTVQQYATIPTFDLKGTGTGDIMPLLMIAMPELQQTVNIKRLTPQEFAIRGAVPAKKESVEDESDNQQAVAEQPPLSAVSKWSWDTIEAYGVISKRGELWTKYEEEQLRIVPVKIPIGQRGQFLAKSVLDLRSGQQLLRVEPGPVLKDVEFSESMTRKWLQYVSPVFADATDLQGEFSLETKGAVIDLISSQPQELQGTLKILSCKLGPGPAILKATAPVMGIRSLLKPSRQSPQFLKPGSKWIELPRQDVHFTLKQQRIYHDQLLFQAGQVKIVSSGSVGLDQTLDNSITIPLDFIKGNDKPLLGLLKQQDIIVYIRGTLQEPQVDASKMADLPQQLAPAAIDGLLQRLIEKRRKKNK